jgi:hypothetical protein
MPAWGSLLPHNPKHELVHCYEERVSVGSGPGNTWIPPNPAYISRHHFVLERSAGTIRVTALSKSNATFVNGLRLQPHQPARVLDDPDNARHQIPGCPPAAPIIFCVVPNRCPTPPLNPLPSGKPLPSGPPPTRCACRPHPERPSRLTVAGGALSHVQSLVKTTLDSRCSRRLPVCSR